MPDLCNSSNPLVNRSRRHLLKLGVFPVSIVPIVNQQAEFTIILGMTDEFARL